jgi:hypothetical protein
MGFLYYYLFGLAAAPFNAVTRVYELYSFGDIVNRVFFFLLVYYYLFGFAAASFSVVVQLDNVVTWRFGLSRHITRVSHFLVLR